MSGFFFHTYNSKEGGENDLATIKEKSNITGQFQFSVHPPRSSCSSDLPATRRNAKIVVLRVSKATIDSSSMPA